LDQSLRTSILSWELSHRTLWRLSCALLLFWSTHLCARSLEPNVLTTALQAASCVEAPNIDGDLGNRGPGPVCPPPKRWPAGLPAIGSVESWLRQWADGWLEHFQPGRYAHAVDVATE